MQYTVYTKEPADFGPHKEAAGCYLEYQGKMLLLRRHPQKPHGNKWGVPGGKMEAGESARQAAVRETFEEVGLRLDPERLEEVATFYIKLPDFSYVYHLWHYALAALPEIKLALDEHLEARWLSPSEALQMPLLPGGIESLQAYAEWLRSKHK